MDIVRGLQAASQANHMGPRTRCPVPLLAVLVLFLCAYPAFNQAFSVHVNSKARNHISEAVKTLPVARDILGDMGDSMRMQWSHDLGLTINQTIDLIKEPKVPITVDVKLVGFNGDGNEGLVVQDHDLLVFLKALHNQLDTVALHPEPRHLTAKPEFEFRVMPVYYEVGHKLQGVISTAINSRPANTTWTNYPMHLIPAIVVDDVIAEDFDHHGDNSGSYTIYILNPKITQVYAYTYDDGEASCPGTQWVSKKRYAWYDLSANISFLGPGPGGKGHVFQHSVPVLKHYKADSIGRAILPDLAALVWSACQHLLWPPLHHSNLKQKAVVAIHVIYLHQNLLVPPSHLDADAIRRELSSAMTDVQSVSVSEHWVSFSTCDHCVTAYASALKARTSRNPAKWQQGFSMSVNQYLDVRELERWMEQWKESILAEAGISYTDADPEHVLPVFIFDLPTKEPILLDGWRQAAALDTGDVIAVRTEAEPVATFFGCYDQQVKLDPKQLHRPVLAAVLQAGWGVSDTALYWSQATGRGWNFLWSVGQTPFGVLSGSSVLSFAQRDAMKRNAALAAMNISVYHTTLLLEGYNTLSGYQGDTQHVKQFLNAEQVIPYHQRLSLLLYKLQEACLSISKMRLPLAIGYAQSSGHDAAALRKITKRVKKAMQLDLVCAGTEHRDWWWAVPIISAAIAATLFTWRIARGSGADEVAPPDMRGFGSGGRSSIGGSFRRMSRQNSGPTVGGIF